MPDSVRLLAHSDNGIWQDPENMAFGSDGIMDLQVTPQEGRVAGRAAESSDLIAIWLRAVPGLLAHAAA